MKTALLLSPAYGWFAGLLVVMIVVTALFALILWIALKPVKKDELDDSSSAKKALGRRETELTIELLNSQNDAKKRDELERELREVKSAERLVGELMPEDEISEEKPTKPARQAKVSPRANSGAAQPERRAVPPQANANEASKPTNARPSQPARAAEPVKAAEPDDGGFNEVYEQPAKSAPAQPAKSASAQPARKAAAPKADAKQDSKN